MSNRVPGASDLRGRRVVVVGSASITGQRTAQLFLARGAQVTGIDLRDAPPQGVCVLCADMTDPGAAQEAFEGAERLMGGIDVLVTGLARQKGGRLHETSEETWQAVMDGTLRATFHAMKSALPMLDAGSSIVAISSVNGRLAHPGNAAYATAKGGIDAMVRQAALEYAPRGVRVNAVAPGLIDDAGTPQAGVGYPMGRAVTPLEVAEAIVFLASPAASGITGVILPVDAGLSIASPVAFARPSMFEEWQEGARRRD